LRAILQATPEARLGEPAMNAMLVAALMSACVVNVACLVGHLIVGA
jgi:hypothetical protein